MKQWSDLAIGDIVWEFQPYHREWRPDGSKTPYDQYRQRTIVGETRVSWITEEGYKLKKREHPKDWFVDWEEVEQLVWVRENQHHIANAVYACRTYTTLKAIADLLGYTPVQEDR